MTEKYKAQQKAYRQHPEVKERIRAYGQRQEVKERHKIRNRVYARQPEIKAKHSAYYKTHNQRPEIKKKLKVRQLWRYYGLTPEALASLISGQGNVCAICKSTHWGPSGPNVDHNHITGVIRGILCGRCNTGIGFLCDNPKIMRAAADYLETT